MKITPVKKKMMRKRLLWSVPVVCVPLLLLLVHFTLTGNTGVGVDFLPGAIVMKSVAVDAGKKGNILSRAHIVFFEVPAPETDDVTLSSVQGGVAMVTSGWFKKNLLGEFRVPLNRGRSAWWAAPFGVHNPKQGDGPVVITGRPARGGGSVNVDYWNGETFVRLLHREYGVDGVEVQDSEDGGLAIKLLCDTYRRESCVPEVYVIDDGAISLATSDFPDDGDERSIEKAIGLNGAGEPEKYVRAIKLLVHRKRYTEALAVANKRIWHDPTQLYHRPYLSPAHLGSA